MTITKYKNPDKRISRDKCYELLKQYRTPAHVIRHCEGVTDCALRIACELNKHGYNLDLALIQGAGLIHDIARVKDKHWEEGAAIARSLGYYDEADIIQVHMFYPKFNKIEDADETDMVCLGDRTVLEDQFVGLEKRIEYVINKVKRNIEEQQIIYQKMHEADRFIKDIEKLTGKTLAEIVIGKVNINE